MTTKDPHLVKTPIDKNTVEKGTINRDAVNKDTLNKEAINQQAVQNDETKTVTKSPKTTHVDKDTQFDEDADLDKDNTVNSAEAKVSENKGTATLKTDAANTEHVKDLDNPARQPDRRDQEGQTPFDKGINDDTVGKEAPKSDDINDFNRYANIDNAQKRVLTPDERD